MSDEIKTIREALERASARIGCPAGDNADADLYREIMAALSALDQLSPTAEKVDIPEAIKALGFIKEIGERPNQHGFQQDWIEQMVKWANHGIASLTP